jgi:hypothetical protein
VRTIGGLKLELAASAPDDRRVRCAEVSLSPVDGGDAGDAVALVTDSRGRMRYRLADGDYVLRLAAGLQSRFSVRDGRWTSVRVRLP